MTTTSAVAGPVRRPGDAHHPGMAGPMDPSVGPSAAHPSQSVGPSYQLGGSSSSTATNGHHPSHHPNMNGGLISSQRQGAFPPQTTGGSFPPQTPQHAQSLNGGQASIPQQPVQPRQQINHPPPSTEQHLVQSELPSEQPPPPPPQSSRMDSSYFIDPKRAASLIRILGLKGSIKPFGSYTSGLITKTSDLDVMYERHEDERDLPAVLILQKFMDHLGSLGFVNFVTVFQAQLPLLKLADHHGVDIDICVDNHLGYRNSLLMGSYARIDRRVPDFIRRVKCFAKRFEVVGSTDGHLNSYAWTLMAVYYLMHTDPFPVLPNLQHLGATDPGTPKKTISDSRWGQERTWNVTFFMEVQKIPPSANQRTTQELLSEFFDFYANKFDWDTKCVSIRHGMTPADSPTGVDRRKLDDYILNQKEQSGWYVEDPFDLCHNLAGNVTAKGKQRIKQALQIAVKEIHKFGPDRLSEALNHLCPLAWKPQAFFMKCRVNLEKISETEFREAFAKMAFEDEVCLWWPHSGTATGLRILDAFLQFRSDKDRKKAHTKSESYVGSWQIRLLYCCCAVVRDAHDDNNGNLQRAVVNAGAHAEKQLKKSEQEMPIIPSIKMALSSFANNHDPRQKNFQALRHLYFISQNQHHLLMGQAGSPDALEAGLQSDHEELMKGGKARIGKGADHLPNHANGAGKGGGEGAGAGGTAEAGKSVPESEIEITNKLGSAMATVTYLLAQMDANFLEHFLQDPRNGNLISTLQKLHQLYQSRMANEGRPPPGYRPPPHPERSPRVAPAANDSAAVAAPGGAAAQPPSQEQQALAAGAPPGGATATASGGAHPANKLPATAAHPPPVQQGVSQQELSPEDVFTTRMNDGLHRFIPNLSHAVPQPYFEEILNSAAVIPTADLKKKLLTAHTVAMKHKTYPEPIASQVSGKRGKQEVAFYSWLERILREHEQLLLLRDHAGATGSLPRAPAAPQPHHAEEQQHGMPAHMLESARQQRALQQGLQQHQMQQNTPRTAASPPAGQLGAPGGQTAGGGGSGPAGQGGAAAPGDSSKAGQQQGGAPVPGKGDGQPLAEQEGASGVMAAGQPQQGGHHSPFLTQAQMQTFLKAHPNLVAAAVENPDLVASFMDPKDTGRARDIVQHLTGASSGGPGSGSGAPPSAVGPGGGNPVPGSAERVAGAEARRLNQAPEIAPPPPPVQFQ